MAAIAYLAANDGDGHLSPDPRYDYWTSPISDAEWNTILGNIRADKYPGSGHFFSSTDFTDAQKQLVKEIGWVINVHSYMNELSAPFVRGRSAWRQVRQPGPAGEGHVRGDGQRDRQ
jgi:hypothetical protein